MIKEAIINVSAMSKFLESGCDASGTSQLTHNNPRHLPIETLLTRLDCTAQGQNW